MENLTNKSLAISPSQNRTNVLYIDMFFNNLPISKDDFFAERTSLYLHFALHGRSITQSALSFGFSQCSLRPLW